MDLDTFMTTLYVLVDDWYQSEMAGLMKRRRGAKPKMSDSEVLTVALAGQWRVGVPWRSERGVVRYMQAHGRQWFPHMLGRSAFNARVRNLWGALVKLQQVVAVELHSEDDVYESVDCRPLPACSLAQAASHKPQRLWTSGLGRGGNNGGWFYGEQLLAAVTPSGVVTGWLIGPPETDDRWIMDAFLSARAGQTMHLVGPPPSVKREKARQRTPPVGPMGPLIAPGPSASRPYVADQGFNGDRWRQHWRTRYAAEVITAPPANAPDAWPRGWKRWLSHHRQIVDTVFSWLDEVFGMNRLHAHSRWGQYTRVAAKMAAYNIGRYINRLAGRPEGALETLLC